MGSSRINVILNLWWTTNARIIGLGYVSIGVSAGFTGLVYSICVRFELCGCGEQSMFGDYHWFNVMFSHHAAIMIFFFIMPTLIGGLANLYLPVILGVPEMVFPRLNAVGLWILPLAYGLLVLSSQLEDGMSSGWTLYPPLTSSNSHSGIAIDVFLVSLHMAGFSSVAGSVNVLVTCAAVSSSRGSTNSTANLFCAGMLITSMLLLFVVPVLAAGLAMLLSDSNLNSIYFDVAGGGDALLYQHLFWFFGHPEVYILIIPSFSIVSQCLQEEGAFSLFNSLGMVFAVGSIAFVGFFVWAHHMFAVGLDIDSSTYYSSITMAIGLPTSIKVFSWLVCTISTLVGSVILIGVLSFVTCIVAGGVTGLVLANSEIDLVLHDSYFVVGHFHLVLALAAVFGVIIGLLSAFSLRTGSSICDLFTGRFVFPGFVLGAGSIFWQFHLCGLLGCPRVFLIVLIVLFPITVLAPLELFWPFGHVLFHCSVY